MSISDFGFIDPDDMPTPDVFGSGHARCSCGTLGIGIGGGSPAFATIAFQCPTCGEWVEVIPAEGTTT